MAFTLPPLPYPSDALEPHIDKQTMEIHHGKHHNAYVTNLNAALDKHPDLYSKSLEDLLRGIATVPEDIRGAVRNNGGGHHNHSLFWTIMKTGGGGEPKGALADAIQATFGDFAKFKDTVTNNGMTRFGSGWSWLRSEEHTSELQSPYDLVCRLLLEKKKKRKTAIPTYRYPRNGQPKLTHMWPPAIMSP